MPELGREHSVIVLDLEWNQRYGRQQGFATSLAQEIVEIGAVKLDASLRIVGHFEASVRPVVHPVMHRHVRRLTGISDEDCREGCPFREAGEALIGFCGEDFILCTWGPDDYPVLQRNLAYWMLPQGWLPGPVDAQRMYALLQCAGKVRQVSLEDAMEALRLPLERPSHRALHDAHHTAQVVKRLHAIAAALPQDDPRLRALYEADAQRARQLEGHDDLCATPHKTIESLLADEPLFAPACPRCGAPGRALSGRLHLPDKRMLEQYAACERHGYFRMRFLPQRTVAGTLSLWRCAAPATEQQARLFLGVRAGHAAKRRNRRRSRESRA
ncbi:MAG: exonuclease domain-containing protein [Clostridia bacterium]|nr:exonuclease domain-containing protein [Clostridia bacterium]